MSDRTYSQADAFSRKISKLIILELESLIKDYNEINSIIDEQHRIQLEALAESLTEDSVTAEREETKLDKQVNGALSLLGNTRSKMDDLFMQLAQEYIKLRKNNDHSLDTKFSLGFAKDILEGRVPQD